MRTKVTIFNPSKVLGGTTNLLLNLARLLYREENIQLTYVDYERGPTINYLKSLGVDCSFKTLQKNQKIDLKGELVICILLAVKSIKNNMLVDGTTRFIFWNTHPDDGIKILPTFNFFYKLPKCKRKKYAGILNPNYKKRVGKFIEQAMCYGGLAWMDYNVFDGTKYFYDIKAKPAIWPLVTTSPTKEKKNIPKISYPIKIGVLGRLCDFKIIPVFALLEQLKDVRDDFELIFIGEGPYKHKLLDELNLYDYKYELTGNVVKKDLDDVLLNMDMVIAVATSVLESAKLKIPSIVFRSSYYRISPDNLKMNWLFDSTKYFVGKLIEKNSDQMVGKKIGALLSEYISKKEEIGNRSYEHWKSYHSDEALKKIALKQIEDNRFYFTASRASLLKFDFSSKMVTVAKNILHRIKPIMNSLAK